MSVKKNIFWNMLLTLSGYLFPMLTFPYVTRVLGAGNLGIVNYALGIVDYAVLFSTLGMSMVGIRYISQNAGDAKRRNDVFSSLVSIHIMLSALVLAFYIGCIFFIPSLADHHELYYVGTAKIIFNVILVEWLFQGMQDFRYITIRTMLIRMFYVIGVFVLVRSSKDYDTYFYITITQVVINALVNWRYAQRFISFNFRIHAISEYLFPILSMGINAILLSFYTTFNVIYLGSVCDNEAVGYYTTAIKLYSIILSVISAYNGVFVPHLNQLYAEGDINQFKTVVSKSIHLITLVSLPTIAIAAVLAPQIIEVVAGQGFERSSTPFRVVMIQILLVGIAQILENQVLLAFKRFKSILICTASSVFLAIITIVVFVPIYAEVAAAYAIAIPHIFEVALLFYFANQDIKIILNTKQIFSYMTASGIVAAICIGEVAVLHNVYVIVLTSLGLSFFIYYFFLYFIFKDPILRQITQKVVSKAIISIQHTKNAD